MEGGQDGVAWAAVQRAHHATPHFILTVPIIRGHAAIKVARQPKSTVGAILICF